MEGIKGALQIPLVQSGAIIFALAWVLKKYAPSELNQFNPLAK